MITKYRSLAEDIDKLLFESPLSEMFSLDKEIASRFGLIILSTRGITRTIFRKKGSRYVLKVGYPLSNRAEFCLYLLAERQGLGKILAKSHYISKNGFCLVQEYVGGKLPKHIEEEDLERIIKKIKPYFTIFNEEHGVYDFHDENIRVCRNGDLKIVDYAGVLSPKLANSKKDFYKFCSDLQKRIKLKEHNLLLKVDGLTIIFRDFDET